MQTTTFTETIKLALSATLLGLSSLLLTSQASAAVIIEGGGVTITETETIEIETGTTIGEYQVQNNSSLDLFAIAISNNNGVLPYTNVATASDGSYIGWVAETINASSWDTYVLLDMDYNDLALNSFGLFTDFFAADDNVNLYVWGGESDLINAGASVSGAFLFNPALLASSGLVIGTNGTTNSAIAVSAVPVPAAIWLFGSGLLGLVGIARRKKS